MTDTATATETADFEHEDAPTRPEDREFFRIPAARYDYLCERIAKLMRRRHKLLKSGSLADAAPITVEKVSTEIERGRCVFCERTEAVHLDNGQCYQPSNHTFAPGAERVYFICRVTGPAPLLEGYEFIATLQHENAGTILRTVPTAKIEDGELDRFRTVKPHCEHCKVRRFRKDSFVVRDVESGETLQLGRNCLGKYIGGGASPKSIAALAELLITVQDAGFEEESYGWGRGELAASLPQFLTFVATSIRLDGWTSRGRAREDESLATVDHVWTVLFPAKDKHSQRAAAEFRTKIIDADRQTAIRALLLGGERLVTNERLGDYEHNLRIALSSEYVTGKRAGLVGSLIAWYERTVGIEAQKRAQREADKKARVESKHFGTVKERLELTVTVMRIFDAESDQWGVSHGHFFKTDNGNVAVWWTGTQRLDVGATYKIKGTVKAHDDYKGTAQTALSRCKVIEKVGDAA